MPFSFIYLFIFAFEHRSTDQIHSDNPNTVHMVKNMRLVCLGIAILPNDFLQVTELTFHFARNVFSGKKTTCHYRIFSVRSGITSLCVNF